MAVSAYSYTIYHSPNAYLGTALLRRAVAELPGVELVRRPIYVPREHGLMIAAGTARCRAPRAVPMKIRRPCRAAISSISATVLGPEEISTTPRPGSPITPTSASNSPRSLIVDGIGTPPWPEWLSE